MSLLRCSRKSVFGDDQERQASVKTIHRKFLNSFGLDGFGMLPTVVEHRKQPSR